MSAVIVIPARLQSTRLPCKMMLADTGKPLIVHTCESVVDGGMEVCVATDSAVIREAVKDHFGSRVQCVMTGEAASGTDRVAAAAAIRMDWPSDTVIINLQGDEPELGIEPLKRLAAAMETYPPCEMATLATHATEQDQVNPDVVKVNRLRNGLAVDFARTCRPSGFRHIGVYAYTKAFVYWFTRQDQTYREQTERLEQLRALQSGCRIRVEVIDHQARGIDTRADYDAFCERLAG